MMKKIFVILLLALLPFVAGAQDARQRTASTIVADGLAQLPAADVRAFEAVMGELAATGQDGVEMIAGMLVPAAEGKNAVAEYALGGIVAYATAPGREVLVPPVRRGLLVALDRCADNANRAFLLQQLQACAVLEDAPAIARYLNDAYLADGALRALVSIPGTEELLLSLAAETPDQAGREAFARAFAAKRMAQAEPLLLTWLAAADEQQAPVFCYALAECGTRASIKPLAARIGGAQTTATTQAYLRLLSELVRQGEGAAAVKAARELLKDNRVHVRGGALSVLAEALPVKALMPYVLAAVEQGPAEYRFAALEALGKGDDAVFEQLVRRMPKYDPVAQAALIAWLGEQGAVSQAGAVAQAVASPDDRVACAAIEAAGRIGGPEALGALAGALGGAHNKQALAALQAFNGEIEKTTGELLGAGEPQVVAAALQLAAARRMSGYADRVFALLGAQDEAVRTAAYEALPYVVGAGDAARLAGLLDTVDAAHAGQVRLALVRATAQLPEAERYAAIDGYMKASKNPARYYAVLAATGTQEAVDNLAGQFESGDREAAFEALLTIDRGSMCPLLYRIAAGNAKMADRALMRYADLVGESAATPIGRYQLCRSALELKPSAEVTRKLLSVLATVREWPALQLAAGYLAQEQVAEAAASAVRTIVAKSTPMPGGDEVRRALEQAREIYKELARNDADAGYAVDEITGLLAKVPATGFAPLAADLSAWKHEPAPRAHVGMARKAPLQTPGWGSVDGVLTFTGDVPQTVALEKPYENFEMWFDWRTPQQVAVILRSLPLVELLGEEGVRLLAAGETAEPTVNAPGEWNTLYIKVVDDRMTLVGNGRMVAENRVIANPAAAAEPIPAQGSIALAGSAAGAEFRNFWLHELPSTPVCTLSDQERGEGFELLFDGRSLHKWTGNTVNYTPLEGVIDVTASYGGSGNLYTVREYADFDLRFEFRFLRRGVNNGIGIRTPMGVDAAYQGMEVQVLDHDAPIYKNLHVYQQHGSVYGIIPAQEHVDFGELGSWNTMRISAVGDRIKVWTNDRLILDGDIREACQGQNVAPGGEKKNPYTVDGKNHPGLFNKSGHIGLLGHGTGIQFRNLRVLDLGGGAK